MAHAASFGLLCFSSLFTIIDPLAAAPLFVAMTAEADATTRRQFALSSSLLDPAKVSNNT